MNDEEVTALALEASSKTAMARLNLDEAKRAVVVIAEALADPERIHAAGKAIAEARAARIRANTKPKPAQVS